MCGADGEVCGNVSQEVSEIDDDADVDDNDDDDQGDPSI